MRPQRAVNATGNGRQSRSFALSGDVFREVHQVRQVSLARHSPGLRVAVRKGDYFQYDATYLSSLSILVPFVTQPSAVREDRPDANR